jgi:predicted nucleic acid-binding protein
MLDAIISDTSCLIILKKIDQLDLLQQLYKTVAITHEIATE